jgi:hypothetical protein
MQNETIRFEGQSLSTSDMGDRVIHVSWLRPVLLSIPVMVAASVPLG